MTQQSHRAGPDIDLDQRGLHAVGRHERRPVVAEMAGKRQAHLRALGQQLRLEVHDLGEIGEADACAFTVNRGDHPVAHRQPCGAGLQELRRGLQHDGAQLARGMQRQFAADRGAARGAYARAVGRGLAIT